MDKVELFRALAVEARSAASHAATLQSRAVFENVAATYERLARWSDCRLDSANAAPRQ